MNRILYYYSFIIQSLLKKYPLIEEGLFLNNNDLYIEIIEYEKYFVYILIAKTTLKGKKSLRFVNHDNIYIQHYITN